MDGDGEDFEDDLDDAISHVTVAKAYWDARTQDGAFEDFNDVAMNWGPSFRRRRARHQVDVFGSPQRCAAGAQDLRDRSRRRHFAAGQGLRQHHARRAYERRHPDYWPAGSARRASTPSTRRVIKASGQPKAEAAANAYDKLAAMYDSRYSAENRVSDTQIAIDAAIDEDLEDRPRDERIAALNNTIRYGLKLEIKSARDTNTAGRTQPRRGADLHQPGLAVHGLATEPRLCRITTSPSATWRSSRS